MPTCLQCGKCCLGLDWTLNFEAPKEDPNAPSKEIMQKAIERMNSYGLFYHDFKSADLKEGWLSMTFNVGVCQNLAFKEDKALCKIHDHRPAACSSYFCEKAKETLISNL